MKLAFYLQRGGDVGGPPCNLTVVSRDRKTRAAAACPEQRQQVAGALWGLNLVEIGPPRAAPERGAASLAGFSAGFSAGRGAEGGADVGLAVGPCGEDAGAREHVVAGCAEPSRARMHCVETPLRVTFDPGRVSRVLCGPLPLPIDAPAAAAASLFAVGMSVSAALALCVVQAFRRTTPRRLKHARSTPRRRRRRKKKEEEEEEEREEAEEIRRATEIASSPSLERIATRIGPVKRDADWLELDQEEQEKLLPPPPASPSPAVLASLSTCSAAANFYDGKGTLLLPPPLDDFARDAVPIPSADVLSTTASFRDFLQHTVYNSSMAAAAAEAEHPQKKAEPFDYDFEF
jgi:hypothetical protein